MEEARFSATYVEVPFWLVDTGSNSQIFQMLAQSTSEGNKLGDIIVCLLFGITLLWILYISNYVKCFL